MIVTTPQMIHYVEDVGRYNNELIDYTKLIKFSEFKLDDPYDLAIDIIDDNPELPSFLKKEFKIQTWKSWAEHVYVGEVTAVDVYAAIFEMFESNNHRYFSNLNYEERLEIHKFLYETVAEEKKHSNLVEYMFEKCNYNFHKITKDAAYEKLIQDEVNENNLLRTMFYYNMGECEILTTLSLIIRHTVNEDKKNYLKMLLQEESKHFNGFTKVMRLIRKNITKEEITPLELGPNGPYFYKMVYHPEYLGTMNIPRFFNYCKENLLQSDPQNQNIVQKFWKSIESNQFQQEHYSLFNRKFYMYYNILFPDVSADEYNRNLKTILNSFVNSFQWEPRE